MENAKYSTILLGEVVGVRLTDYAAARQKQMREGAKYPWASDANPGYEIEVLPIELLKGANGTGSARWSRCAFLRALQPASVFWKPSAARLECLTFVKDVAYATRS